MQRPAFRRASQQSAYRPDAQPSPPRPDQYGPDPQGPTQPGPTQPGREQYGPDQYGPDQYGPRQPGPEHGSYQQDPGQQGPYQYVSYQQDLDGGPYLNGGPGGPYDPGPPHEPDPSWQLPDGPGRPRRDRRARKVRKHRLRRLLRLRSVRVILALVAVFCCWLAFSVGQALTAPGGGSASSKLAEWARDHYLGPVVTFGEWLTYNPPKVGGKPSFSLAVPSAGATKYKHTKGFQPFIPARLSSPAGAPLPGEGQWRVLETVKGEPAIFGTFLRPSSVYTSYVAGIVSMDQRLVSFQLHPGAEDPGAGKWNSPAWIPPGSRTGLLATFNGGFKLDSAGGGFYLNGASKGSLVNGAASVVYYRNGTVKIGSWGSEVRMTSQVEGVRQNLKLIVDHGQVPASVNQDVLGSWGATLGGSYYVWRSGMGITANGRVIFAYGPALNVQELASLLQRAGAVEALQLDINPYWMSYEYYQTAGHPSDPTPVNLLPTQQQTPYRYYSVYSRDFTAVYAR